MSGSSGYEWLRIPGIMCVCVFAQGKKQEFSLCENGDVQLTDVVVN